MSPTRFWKRSLFLLLATFAVVAVLGCNQSTTTTTTITQLPIVTEVDGFADYSELRQYLRGLFDETEYGYRFKNYEFAVGATTTAMTSVNGQAEDSATPSHSETNNQVEGVEEYDTALTDGNHIYLSNWSHFFILDPDTLEIQFDLAMENGSITGMFLEGDRLVVLGSEYSYDETKTGDDYYYWYHYRYGVKVWVYDVAEVTAEVDPILVKELYFDNSYLADARMIDGNVHLVMNNYTINYGFSEDDFVPVYRDSAASDGEILIPADQIYIMPNDNFSVNYLLIASFNAMDEEAARVDAYLGSTYQIYMSPSNLYTVVYNYVYDPVTFFYDYSTYVLRFALTEEHHLVYQAMGEVDGSPLNQFSMDEYDGVFRIATTGYAYSPTSWTITNTLYLLDATTPEEMPIVSQLEHLGKPNERIYAVRFDEEEAFVVTFVQTDPLYWLDLSDPTDPKIIDELHQDGVSDYLHVINDELKLGIGRESQTIDGITRFTGVKIELYRAANEELVSVGYYKVEGEYSYTNVGYDHKAFLSYTPPGADFMYVAIPVYVYSIDWYRTTQNLYVFQVFFDGSMSEPVTLSHVDETISEAYCWYYDSIERALIIGTRIYTISSAKIQMFDMANDFAFVAKTELEDQYRYWYWVD